jgi:protein tyrosine/serine phosphatase
MSGIQNAKTRHLDWEGCYNVRDLGGLLTLHGYETRWQSVIRADLPGRLTPRGQRDLLAYGVRTIIDLRAPQEAKEEPSLFTTPGKEQEAPDYFNLPLERYQPHVGAMIKQAKSRAEVYCIVLDAYPDAIAEVLRAIANARPGGVLIHCHSGKDRTGIVAALLLSLVGVSAEQIVADYGESQIRLRPLYEQAIARVGGEENADFWLKQTATPEMMRMTLAHLEVTYGGVHHYLHQAAGLSLLEIESVKQCLGKQCLGPT